MIKIGLDSNGITLNIIRRTYPDASDYWDGNWLTVEIYVHVGGWKGNYAALLRSEELLHLKNELEMLYKQPDYSFILEPIEPWIVLNFIGNKKGQITVKGQACDEIGIGNTLGFCFGIDQSYLPEIIKSLRETIDKFPVKGKS